MKVRQKVKGKIKRSADVAEIIRHIMLKWPKYEQDKEHFFTIGLLTDATIRYIDLTSVGTLNSSIVHAREVFRTAILNGCNAVIVAHNHPSENVEPSRQDKEVTEYLKNAGKIIGIDVLDHIIVSHLTHKHYSFHADMILPVEFN